MYQHHPHHPLHHGTTAPPPVDRYRDKGVEMTSLNENLARAQIRARLGEAHERRLGHQLVRAHRVSRKAEQAARRTRDSLAGV
jgi:uncharacterized protein YkwD